MYWLSSFLISPSEPYVGNSAVKEKDTSSLLLESDWVDADMNKNEIHILPNVFELPKENEIKELVDKRWQIIWNEELGDNEKKIQYLFYKKFKKTNFDEVPEARKYFSNKIEEEIAAKKKEKSFFGESASSGY